MTCHFINIYREKICIKLMWKNDFALKILTHSMHNMHLRSAYKKMKQNKMHKIRNSVINIILQQKEQTPSKLVLSFY